MKNQSENKVYTLAEVLGKHTIAELKQMTQVLEVKGEEAGNYRCFVCKAVR